MKKIIFFHILSPIITFSQVFSDFYPESNGELVNHNYYSLAGHIGGGDFIFIKK